MNEMKIYNKIVVYVESDWKKGNKTIIFKCVKWKQKEWKIKSMCFTHTKGKQQTSTGKKRNNKLIK